MCAARIYAISRALFIESGRFAKDHDALTALTKRREAERLYAVLPYLAPDDYQPAHHRYLQFWLHISEGNFSLENGDFDKAISSFHEAAALADGLDEKKVFP